MTLLAGLLLLLGGLTALVVAALLLERQAHRHEKLVLRLVEENIAVREDALVERASLLNRIAAPQVLQSITPTGVLSRAITNQSPIADERGEDDEELELVGSILPEVAE